MMKNLLLKTLNLTFLLLLSLSALSQEIRWVETSAGKSFTIGITSGNGKMYAWGKNDVGQLGNGTLVNTHKPTQVGSDSNWMTVVSGLSHNIALKNDGTLWAWGLNNDGQLGDGTTTNRNLPVQIGTRKYAKIASGWNHCFAIEADGTLWGWGDNLKGQVGDGTNIDKNTPTKIGTEKWHTIAAGNLHTLGIDLYGNFYAWGSNSKGQLGNFGSTDENTPYAINDGPLDAHIACGEDISFYGEDISLRAAGAFTFYNTLDYRGVPFPITIGGIQSISCFNKTIIVTSKLGSNWTVSAYGDNSNGELGIGNFISDTLNKIIIKPSTTNYKISCGYDHTSFLKKGEDNICPSGNNDFGQIGTTFKTKLNYKYCLSKKNFKASDKVSDAKVELSWDERLKLPILGYNPAAYIQIRELATNKEVYSEVIDSIYNYERISGKTLTFIKPNQEKNYQLRVIEYGPGTILMEEIMDTGSTKIFQKPNISGSAANPWDIKLNVKSNSDYDQKMYLYRGDSLITILDTAAKEYLEICDPEIKNTIANGSSYTYKILSINNTDVDSTFGTQTVTQGTYVVDFKAEDLSTNNKVKLTWNNLSAYVTNLIIRRDGLPLTELNGEDVYYEDLTAIPGYAHLYSFELYQNEELKITFTDRGSLAPNGEISGYVFNPDPTNFTIPNVTLTAIATVAGITDTVKTTTDANGYYSFKDLAYYKIASFEIKAQWKSTETTESITLDLANNVKKLDFNLKIPSTELTNVKHEITGLKANAVDSMGIVSISWETTGTDTIHYLVYRGEEIIKVGNQIGLSQNSYDDLQGVPFVEYEYSIKTYDRTYNSSSKKMDFKFSDGLKDSARFPQPYAIKKEDFTAVGNATNATINLTWKHPRGNIDGFRIFRNNIKINEVPKTALSYTDLTGKNTETYTYAVHAFKTLKDNSYNSSKAISNPVIYPALNKPATPAVTNNPRGFAKINWTYTTNPNYNYDGFHVLREYNGNTIQLGSVRKSLPKEFFDETGIPGRGYRYSVQAYKTNIQSTSVPSNSVNHTYLDLPEVTITLADGSKEGLVKFTTSVDFNYDYLKVIVRDQSKTNTYDVYNVNKGGTQIPWNNYTAGTQKFAFNTVKTIDGIEYYSSKTTEVDVTITENGPYAINAVENLTATTNNSSHVKLKWEYPNFYIPFFHIYRDGIWIDSIEGVQKVYYDHKLVDNKKHLYQVQVKLDTRKSKMAGVYGQKIGKTYIYGTVYKEKGKEGIANANVILYLPLYDNTLRFYTETTTDVSGHYEFRNIPAHGFISGTSKIGLDGYHPNAKMEQSATDVIYFDSIFSYNINFKDTLPNPVIPADTITWVKDLVAVANANNQTVELRWNTSNANYTSFEVYRGLEKIATIPSSQSKLVIDDAGFPGYDYSYRVKPIWQKSRFDKIEGEFFSVLQNYPPILPVIELNASILNDKIGINWSHPVDLNVRYEVRRNNEVFSIVEAGERLEVIDSIGTIGTIYKYTVTPLFAKNPDIKAEERSVTAVFPTVKKVREITAVNVPNGVELTWRRPSERTTHYKIFVNGEISDTLKTSQNGEIKYNSYLGIPGANNTYSIAPGYEENGNFYFGKKSYVTIDQNKLISASIVSITPLKNEDQTRITITRANYPHEGISGFEVIRISKSGSYTYDTLALIKYKTDGDYVLSDKTGFPEVNYQYEVYAYSIRNGIKYLAGHSEYVGIFPKLSSPYNMEVKTEEELYSTISWKHNREDVDIQIIKRTDFNEEILTTVEGSIHEVKDPNIYTEAYEIKYSVQAILTQNGVSVYSNPTKSQNIYGKTKEIWVTGQNYYGQLGTGNYAPITSWTKLGGTADWVKAIAGIDYTLAIKKDGTLWAWGFNTSGQLGIGNSTTRNTPVQVGTEKNWKDIDAATSYSVGLKEDGTIWAWGTDVDGSTGQGIKGSKYTTPQQIGSDSDWAFITAKTSNTFAIKQDGTLWGCGDNALNQINKNSTTTYATLQQIGTDRDWEVVSNGHGHVGALKTDGTLWTWGNNASGQLGLGHKNNVDTPTQVNNLKWLEINFAGNHSMALENIFQKRLHGAGNNSNNQMANLTNNNSTFVLFGNDVSKVDAIGNTTIISNIISDCWMTGFNNNANFGNPAVPYGNNSWVPSNYSTGNEQNPFSSAGSTHTLFLRSYITGAFNLTASQDLPNKVELSWNRPAGVFSKYVIYRDGILISTEANVNNVYYTDLDATPGKKHAYSVRMEHGTNSFSKPASALGWTKPSGIVKGAVQSLIGNQPVPDVLIKLKVETEDGSYSYETRSDGKGNFKFDNVYYGENGDVTASASYLDHEFLQDTLLGTMDRTVTSLGIGTFIDKTANLISGTVALLGGNCPLDSIPVTLIKKYNGKANVEETKYTETDGSYTFSVNPFEADLINFELGLPNSIINEQDTVIYNWDKNNVTVNKSIVSSKTPKQNFTDKMGVRQKFSVRNSCTNFPNISFSIDITSEDGCYSRNLSSNPNGVFPDVYLPPLKYTVNVASASPLTSSIIPVLEYLSVRPIKLDLTTYSTNERGDSTLKNLHLEKQALVYHNIPAINLTRRAGVESVLCFPEVLRVQGAPDTNSVTVQLEVLETHSGTQCHVDEGYLIIKNNGATVQNARIDYDPVNGVFENYTFIPGIPATIAPYYKTIVVEYHTKTGFVSEAIYKLLIEGKAAQPGSDVIIDSEDGKDFQIPLAVLRDPPGDNSYSYIEKGVETTSNLSVTKEFGGSFTLRADGQFAIFGVGTEINASAGVGGADGKTKSISFSNITTQRIETSGTSDDQISNGSEYFVGDNADVIMGAGMALKYGIVESIVYFDTTASDGSDSCFIRKSSEIGISADKLKTSWVFTVAHIEALIAEYQNALVLAQEGRLSLSTDNSEETKDTGFYRTLIANWESVLRYHKVNTLPHYNLCDKRVFYNKFSTKSKYREITNSAQSFQEECFCKHAGEYRSGVFELDTAFKWTDETIDRYRIARKKIDALYDLQIRKERGIASSKGYTEPGTGEYSESLLAIYRAGLTEEDKQYAENITFSGNTAIEKSFTNTLSSSQTFNQSVFVNASLYAGIFTQADLKIGTFVGLGGGATFAKKSFDLEARVGGEVTFEFNQEWESESSTTTEETSGYVLGDDDAGDQFSVTVIKGLQNNHTPYFELFAGRSSCPYEPGTISRDRPQLTLEYPDGTLVNNAQYDVDPDGPAYYPIKISNLAPELFNETRYYTFIQAPNSNQFGAQVTADGSGQYYPLVYSVASGGSTYTGFYVNKAGNSYDYPDIDMQLIPTCLDESADLTDGFNGAALHMETYFRKPCSSISILDPTDNWIINHSIDDFQNVSENLEVKIGDYDPENEFLKDIRLEYRRIGTKEWEIAKGLTVNKDSLQRYFIENKSTYKDPVYTFVWDVINQPQIIDGSYELRAVVDCELEGEVISNITRGVIDRSSIALFGTPRPTDGVLNIGEDVQVIFNEPIECGYEIKDSAHYAFYRKSDNAFLEFTPNCNVNSIIYTFDGDLDTLDGEVIKMSVFGVEDLNGNALRDTIKYEFVVSRTPVSWNPYSYEVNVYKGQSQYVELELVNTGGLDATTSISVSGTPADLVDLQLSNAIIQPNQRIKVPIQVNAQGKDIGTYDYTLSAGTITALKNYGIRTIPLKVNVLPVTPSWKVPAGLAYSTVVICNFKLDSMPSTDTMDRIAITLNNEVRGFDNIYRSNADTSLYYAVINVQGDSTDLGKTFQYRVWDASSGAEYDGKMTGANIKFDGGNYGTTKEPRIIDVQSKWDSVRYIPLIKGWNWLAFNYKKESMKLDDMLSGLKLTGGEIVKTLPNKFSVYNKITKKWFASSNGLNTINTAKGYMLFLNKDDVLRVAGANANKVNFFADTGWSLIGNHYQKNRDINTVFETPNKLIDGTILKTGGLTSKASVLDNGTWVGGITEFETNKSYMLYTSVKDLLQYRSTDCDKLRSANFQYNMTFLASVQIDGTELQEEGDYVIAKIDGVCRGRGYLEEVNTPTRRFMLNMFVYGDTADLGKKVTFEIHRTSLNKTINAYMRDTFKFTPDLHKGAPNDPYWFSDNPEFVGIKEIVKKDELNLNIYPNPFTDKITFDLKADYMDMAHVEIYDILGKKVYEASHFCKIGTNKFTILPKDLAKGMYTVMLSINGNSKKVKIIKN